MTSLLIASAICSFVAGYVLQRIAMKVARSLGFLDKPDARRRHDAATPLLGGVGIIATIFVGLVFFGFEDRAEFRHILPSLWPMGIATLLLVVMGLWDDKKGLGPYPKLAVEILAALIVLTFEPHIHALILQWEDSIGPLIWPMALIWIVGITNAINLIDGLDGLAGGMSTLVASSILILSVWTRQDAEFAIIIMSLLIPALLSFLVYNWSPARIFLGDNGSLPIGFLLSSSALICRPQNKSWIMIASVVLMLGYPVLDTSLAVLRRLVKKQPIFRADRTHLHHRILRLGMTKVQTAWLLLSIGFYLQLSALCVNLLSPPAAALGIIVITFSILSLLFMVRSIEQWRVRQLFNKTYKIKNVGGPTSSGSSKRKSYMTITIDIEPLLETGISEEKQRINAVIGALELMIKAILRKTDSAFITNEKIWIVMEQTKEDEAEGVIERLNGKIKDFIALYNLQCSFSGLPIKIETKSLLLLKSSSAVPAELLTDKEDVAS